MSAKRLRSGSSNFLALSGDERIILQQKQQQHFLAVGVICSPSYHVVARWQHRNMHIGVVRIFDWAGPKPSKIRLSSGIGNSNDFSAQNQVISKKKKKKVFTEIKSDFSAQNQVISKKKKKKKVFTEIKSYLRVLRVIR